MKHTNGNYGDGQKATTSTKTSKDAEESISATLEQNIEKVKQALGNSTDIIIREIRIGKTGNIRAAIFYTDGLTGTKDLADFVMKSLLMDTKGTELDDKIAFDEDLLNVLKERAFTVAEINEVMNFEAFYTSLLSGDAILLFEGQTQGFSVAIREWNQRSVTEPAAETIVRGPRESFTESIRTNTALIRRKIKDRNLWLETRMIGRVTKTDVSIMYIHGIVNDKVVEEVRRRLDQIDIDGILESGYIEELIGDEPYSPFPTMYNTERPDVVAADLLEGRVAILVDGTPFVLTAPTFFIQFFQASEDFYQPAIASSLLRMLRFLSFFIALIGSSLYIAVSTFHQEMLPTPLLISLAAQREGVPFPAVIEALIMETAFEILRESSIRMPRAVGQAVSILGTLVIGTAAVDAGIVSAVMVIVISITAISNFIFPAANMSLSVRLIRFPMLLLAASFGLFGIIIGFIALVLHLCSLRSFGVPYTSPLAPFILEDQKDTIIRMPRFKLLTRPRLISQKNITRERPSQGPKSRT
ncbi:spore germination protein [Paenibacillus sp.]|jgi:spore germination protein KA|uniref:spore germination protein n=1 Tax=Paenibacillus sp. TaxID=58172 RepID=UPI002838C258|nr:spore germination protein [Paenibacillus sp.]MDR0267141.1 spore germination protein [Paenibacillus sp.]